MIIMFRGKPGVGKSTAALTLANKLDAKLIAKDDINDIIFAKFGANKLASDLSYDIISYIVNLIYVYGNSIVIDCSLASQSSYQQFTELAATLKDTLYIIRVNLENNNEIEQRLHQRANLPDHRIKTLNDIPKQQLFYEDFTVENEIIVDGSDDVNKIVSDILANID